MLNGNQPKELPGIIIGWDAEAMDVRLHVDPKLGNVDFVLALLGMAVAKVDAQKRLMLAQVMKQQATQQEQTGRILRDLHGGRG